MSLILLQSCQMDGDEAPGGSSAGCWRRTRCPFREGQAIRKLEGRRGSVSHTHLHSFLFRVHAKRSGAAKSWQPGLSRCVVIVSAVTDVLQVFLGSLSGLFISAPITSLVLQAMVQSYSEDETNTLQQSVHVCAASPRFLAFQLPFPS